jgi:transcriptional regulator with XRE-family HTH domain
MGLARIDTRLAQILREEGRMQSWLADRLSEKLGRRIDRAQLNRWVKGIHVPEQTTKAAIAEVLGREIADVFPETEEAAA